MSQQAKPLNVGIVGTGIFATDSHLPTIQRLSNEFTPYSCYNRTKAKAETFATKASIPSSNIHDSLEDIFLDEKVDVIDALLPVQYNLDAVKLAIKYNKPICFEKPLAANLEQAKEIVKLSRKSDLPIFVLEQWSYYKAVDILKSKLSEIGNVVSFSYKSTGPFNHKNKYLATGWRLKPEHIGGFLSDGGVHQLALLTGVLGSVNKVSAFTKQVNKLSGTDDIVYSSFKLESGVIGTFTYGSAFGASEKSCIFEIMGDNGSIKFDFSPAVTRTVTVLVGDGGADVKKEVIEIPDENLALDTEFEVFSKLVQTSDLSYVRTTPEVCFHHLAIVDAALKSSAKDGDSVTVEKP